jgi:hypothetical protein
MTRYYYSYSARGIVEDALNFPVSFLKKERYLEKGLQRYGSIVWKVNGEVRSSASLSVDPDNFSVRIQYSFDERVEEEYREQDYHVRLTTTPCHFGGVRHWFLCPRCFKRVGVLYRTGQRRFACRKCLNLTYESTRLSGIYKRFGAIKSDAEIEEMYTNLRTHYKGKMTKRYKRILKHEEKSDRAFLSIFRALGKG